ncbi:uncharacterized protein [Eucyclogobius newberryi]|uniref:uncharacterized protein isoform X2 n=1 Tax=Eucyclogobius newberryi TaxID=166745 RepID=UPI003B5B49B0
MRTRKRGPPTVRRVSVEVHKSWASPRKRRRTDQASMERSEDPGSNSDNVEEKENSEESPPRCAYLYVTCGTKEGLLHVEKLERGQEDCIESDGRWFSPSGFEEFGGKGTHKKWKKSIIYNNKPLHFWIDQGYLKSSPNKRRTFAASEPSNPKKSHTEESDDKSNHEEEEGPDEQPETSEEQTDVQNGKQTNNFAIDIERIVSQRKPKLILHRLEQLRGDFHLLLNNVVLPQNGSGCMPAEEQREETSEPQEEQREETSEPQEEQREETSEPQEEQREETSEPQEEQREETSEPQEEALLNSSNKENEDVECMHVEDTIVTKDQGAGTSLDEIVDLKVDVEVVAQSFQIHLELEEEAFPLDEIIQDSAPLIERLPQEDNPSVICYPAATTAHQSAADVDFMDLDELKREKIKWQIKILKLQEEYYALQLQKLKQ